jgi:hypothetical protein
MMIKSGRPALRAFAAALAVAVWTAGPLSAQDPGEEIALQEFIFNLPLSVIITPEIVGLYNETARLSDFAWFEPGQFAQSAQIARGRVVYRFLSDSGPMTLSPSVRARCEFFALSGDISGSEAANLRTLANVYKTKTALAPDGDRALDNGAALATDLAPLADLFVIRAELWLAKDTSPDLDMLLEHVRTLAAAVRAANPNVELQVWLGRADENDRLSVERLYLALARLAEQEPRDIGSFGLGRNDSWTDPQSGNNLLVQTHFFVRRKSFVPPGAPVPPTRFEAAASGPASVNLTWTDASTDELGFLLKRSDAPGRPPALVEGFASRPGVVFHRDDAPLPGTYYYWLCAFNDQGLSSFAGPQAADTRGARPNLPPRFGEPPRVVVHRGVPVDLALAATDPDGDTLTYSLSVHPAGMVIDPSSGAIFWLPSAAGRFAISATASDGRSADFLWLEIEVRENN